MSNAFTQFLSGKEEVFRDYQHASRLFVNNTYARAPKFGFLYFVALNINQEAILDSQWNEQKGPRDVGILVKKVDLPKFSIATETLNQYNRKTVVQNKITYQPISIEFHDDNSDITNKLWINYYKNYFIDSNYGDLVAGKDQKGGIPSAYSDTKFGIQNNPYGMYNNNLKEDFFRSIEIYVLHQGNFSQFTIVNPKITEWSHDSLNSSDSAKVLQNRMTVAYENVIYKQGTIVKNQKPESFAAVYYDDYPSPYSVNGIPRNTPVFGSAARETTAFDQQGNLRVFNVPSNLPTSFDKKGKDQVFGVPSNRQSNPLFDQKSKARVYGLVGAPTPPSAAGYLASLLLRNVINKNGLGKLGPVGYNIAGGVMGQVLGSGPGKYAEPQSTQNQPGVFGLPGGAGINIFKGFNTSVDGKIRVNPAAIILPPKG